MEINVYGDNLQNLVNHKNHCSQLCYEKKDLVFLSLHFK